jgi:hypothetical protein
MPTFCFCSSRLNGEGPVNVVASSFLQADLTVQMSYKQRVALSSKFGLYINDLGLTKLISSASIPKQNYNITQNIISSLLTSTSIRPNISLTLSSKSILSTASSLNSAADKISGDVFLDNIEEQANNNDNFFAAPVNGTQKLYPVQDLITSLSGQVLVNEKLQTENLFNSINGGIFVGDFRNDGRTISDTLSYILPSSIYLGGHYRYKAVVENPRLTPKESRLFIRAAAPFYSPNDPDQNPYKYTISNIKFEDPSGNLIIQYRDIDVRGDSNFDNTPDQISYTTYITRPIKNNATLPTQDLNYPILNSNGDYTITFDIVIDSNDAPFTVGFNEGFDDKIPNNNLVIDDDDYLSIGSPFSTRSQEALNPVNSIRISEIEIFNFGAANIVNDTYLNFYTEVRKTGDRIERFLSPQVLLPSSYSNNIFPKVDTVWGSAPSSSGTRILNNTKSSSSALVNSIINDDNSDYIELISSSIADSGKLHLVFTHKTLESLLVYRGGAFASLGNSFRTADLVKLPPINEFFVVDSISLRIKAKKSIGSRDYAIDIVGYSDDKLLNVTSDVGGFLQNDIGGSGSVPQESGFAPVDSLGFSNEAMSDKFQYFSQTKPLNIGGDHYKLSPNVVNSTEFKEYNIPLKIYPDIGRLGQSPEYGLSTYFEQLYLDIYPLPSGAAISSVQIVINYKPSNALVMHTLGEPQYNQKNNLILYPDIKENSFTSITPSRLSNITEIPQAYDSPETFKQNYSRRWRGSEGLSSSSFSTLEFEDFAFNREYVDSPFLNGYFNFNNISGQVIYDDLISSSGVLKHSANLYSNFGLRFNTTSIFDNPTSYRTIDWTAISGYNNNPLYGKIADAFENCLLLSGVNNITFNSFDPSQGFAFFVRLSPYIDANFQSGVIASKYTTSNTLQFLLGYSGGYLYSQSTDNSGNLITVKDNVAYNSYSYPLGVLVTYNSDNSRKLSLYVDNELENHSSWNLKRNTSQSNFIIASGSSPIVLGHDTRSSGNFNSFITNFGISHTANIVDANTNLQQKTINVNRFFESFNAHHNFNNIAHDHKHHLHSFIDDSIDDWSFGDYRHKDFSSSEFRTLSKRSGYDFIYYNIKNNGSPYSNKINTSLPSGFDANTLSYHSQIENDFLRLSLSDAPDNFYSAGVRVNKNLPQGYNFVKDSLMVETVFEHISSGNIIWPNGERGPKLIVSLYTTNKDPSSYSAKNFGLINRGIHYLENKDYIGLLQTGFDFDSFVDDSESWATFPKEKRISEFNHKYFSSDLDKMFIQYDIAYPSGTAYESRLRINSVNVKLNNYISKQQDSSSFIDFVTNGQKYEFNFLNLAIRPHEELFSDLILNVSGGPIYSVEPQSVSLYTASVSGIDQNIIPLYIGAFNTGGFGSDDALFGALDPNAMNLYVSGQYVDNQFLVLHTSGPIQSIYNQSVSMPLITFDNFTKQDTFLPLFIRPSVAEDLIFRSSGIFNLYTEVTNITLMNSYLNLHTDNYFTTYDVSSSLDIKLDGYLDTVLKSGERQIRWNGINPGVNIKIDDNIYASVSVGNEIRGVDLICEGDCSSSGTCLEKGIYTHETQWTEDRCIDGGIFRAKAVYTNPTASGFGNTVGYSGNYYGIKKYEGLVPSAPYFISARALTGKDEFNIVPPKFEEWEYGSNNNVAFSGTKIVSNSRMANAKFGYAVSTSKDILAIGAPNETLIDNGNAVLNAGSVYLYRRLPEPTLTSGSLSSDKTGWILEDRLTLPSGYILDYPTSLAPISLIQGLPFPRTQWNAGQEGRKLGSSLAVAVNSGMQSYGSDKREIIVAGGPDGQFSRTFDQITTNKIKTCIIVFADEFNPNENTFNSLYMEPMAFFDLELKQIMDKNNVLYKYYADPPLQIENKLLVIQPTGSFSNIYYSDYTRGNYLYQTVTPRTNTKSYQSNKQAIDQDMLNRAIDVFLKAFPLNEQEVHNNIPVTIGIYCDNSKSLSRKVVEPLITNFTNWYREYSHASGLTNFYGNPTSGNVYEFFPDFNTAEDWKTMSKIILNNLLDTGRIANSNETFLFAESFGLSSINTNLQEFNFPPSLGGRVYVFEKESGSWNIVQELKNTADFKYNGFGKSVGISDDSLGIVIGSPYTNEACHMLTYDPTVKDTIYDNIGRWLNYRNKTTLINTYNSTSGNQYEKGFHTYGKLSQKEKFDYRQDITFWGGSLPQEYKTSFIYKYDDIPYIGGEYKSWTLQQLNTCRLGWSTAINEDGSIIAFSSPTDSLNRFDDTDLWYGALNTSNEYGLFPSEQYAGSVRVFQSRNYFSHNKAVSFSRFGNLGEESGDLDILGNIFNGALGRPSYKKLEFSEIEIPKDAGLAFITTPSLDAASDEIISNIKDWLSLGDRTLVLVGNDPVYEDNGKYSKSNEIVNKILDKLDSRMRLHPAKNKHEALAESSNCNQVNILPSFQPADITPTYVNYNQNFTGYGAADIRMHMPNHKTLYMPFCDLVNNKCQLPLAHNGDLRASFNVKYESKTDGRKRLNGAAINWARLFRSYKPSNYSSESAFNNPWKYSSIYNLPNQEPIPLLVAGEYLPPYTLFYPAEPAESGLFPVYRTRTVQLEDLIENGTEYYWDAENAKDYNNQIQFLYNFQSGSLTYGGDFFDPSPTDRFDPIIQGKADIRQFDPVLKPRQIADRQVLCAEEIYNTPDNISHNSQVVLLATVLSESKSSLLGGSQDINIQFYTNLITVNESDVIKLRKNDYECITPATIGIIGGWTGRSSFKDGYSESFLEELFFDINSIQADVKVFTGEIPSYINVCWIPNTKNTKPSDLDIENIKNWLNLGGKKLIVTFDDSAVSALAVRNISNGLNINIQPVYLNTAGRFASSFDKQFDGTNDDITIFNDDSSIIKSCLYSLNNETLIINSFYPESLFTANNFIHSPFTPIQGKYYYQSQETVRDVITRPLPIYDNEFIDVPAIWEIDGSASVDMPVIQNSGYTIFINYISEFPNEVLPIVIDSPNFTNNPDPNPYDEDNVISFDTRLSNSSRSLLQTSTFTGKAKNDFIRINFRTYNSNIGLLNNTDYVPHTHRIVSISGVFHPIGSTSFVRRIPRSSYITEQVGQEWRITNAGRAEYSVTIPPKLRAIMNNNTKYCEDICAYNNANGLFSEFYEPPMTPNGMPPSESFVFYCDKYEIRKNFDFDEGGYLDQPSLLSTVSCSNKEIEDGPVVAAQEQEHFSRFFNGNKRSNIILISDKSLIQGQCTLDSNGLLKSNIINFISSLYPANAPADLTARGGRRFNINSKIISPERGSSVRYFHASGLQGLRNAFGTGSPNKDINILNKHSINLSSINPGSIQRKQRSGYTQEKQQEDLENFYQDIVSNYSYIRWGASGVAFEGPEGSKKIVDRSQYSDSINGQIPRTLSKLGKDFIDIEYNNIIFSGFAGDLFGYSIALYRNKLVVGSPCAGFSNQNSIYNWSSGNISNLKLSNYGGAGTVYIYDNDGSGVDEIGQASRWSFRQKLRPSTINVGQDITNYQSSLNTNILGNHNYASGFLFGNSVYPDKFGASLDIDGDMLLIGAPFHDFSNRVEDVYNSGAAFIRKEFDFQFNIPLHKVTDLGSSQNRILYSGTPILNRGAVFSYENEIDNWEFKTQKWTLKEKLVPQGYNSNLQNYSENNMFGNSVAIERVDRKDAKYNAIISAPFHGYGLNISSSGIDKAGSIYIYDGMIRNQPPALSNKNMWLDAKIFSDGKDLSEVIIYIDKSRYDKINTEVISTGIVFTNNQGELYLEGSGLDGNQYGNIENRPYIESVYGQLVQGSKIEDGIRLFNAGADRHLVNSGHMILQVVAPSSAYVYNTLDFYTDSIISSGSRSLNLFNNAGTISGINNSLNIYISGQGLLPSTLLLRGQGK